MIPVPEPGQTLWRCTRACCSAINGTRHRRCICRRPSDGDGLVCGDCLKWDRRDGDRWKSVRAQCVGAGVGGDDSEDEEQRNERCNNESAARLCHWSVLRSVGGRCSVSDRPFPRPRLPLWGESVVRNPRRGAVKGTPAAGVPFLAGIGPFRRAASARVGEPREVSRRHPNPSIGSLERGTPEDLRVSRHCRNEPSQLAYQPPLQRCSSLCKNPLKGEVSHAAGGAAIDS